MKRTFIGLPAGDDAVLAIGAIRDAGPGVRWIPDRNLHITVEFLGPTTEDQIGGLTELLHRERLQRVRLSVSGLSVLPNIRRGRVIAITMEPTFAFEELYSTARKAALQVGIPLKAARISPHLTVARLRDPDSAWLRDYLERRTAYVKSISIREATQANLYASTLSPRGAEYSVLKSFSLVEPSPC